MIIDEKHLLHLIDIIEEHFPSISFEMATTDGACYKLSNLEEILSYSNPGTRKIKKIKISANKYVDKQKLLPDCSIILSDITKYATSCNLDLQNLEEQEIAFFTQRIDEFVKSARVSYWWLHKPMIYMSLGIVLFISFEIWYYLCYNKGQLSEGPLSIFSQFSISFICIWFSIVVVKKVVCFFYPESGFALGEQIKFFKEREKVRNIIGVSIIIALFVGVLSSIIAHAIVS